MERAEQSSLNAIIITACTIATSGVFYGHAVFGQAWQGGGNRSKQRWHREECAGWRAARVTRAPAAPRHTFGTEAAPKAVNFPPWLPVRVLCGPHTGHSPRCCDNIRHWHRVHRLLQLPDRARPTRGPHLPHPAQGGYTDAQRALSTSLGLTENTPPPSDLGLRTHSHCVRACQASFSPQGPHWAHGSQDCQSFLEFTNTTEPTLHPLKLGLTGLLG